MTDWTALAGGYDFSHHNGAIDWGAITAQQPAFVILKATERMGVDPMFDKNRRAAADNAIPWLPYPFLRPDDGDKTIRHFADVVGARGVPPALDWEAAGVPSGVMEAWIAGAETELVRTPLGYWGLNPPDNPPPAAARCPRWYPQYPGRADAAPRLPMWNGAVDPAGGVDWRQTWLIWQWSEKGRVRGVTTAVDLDRLACPAADFLAWYRTGTLPARKPAPAPAAPELTAILRPLRMNMTGDDVAALQRGLSARGFPAVADGEFGPATRNQVIGFQRVRGLSPDGVAGLLTLKALAAA